MKDTWVARFTLQITYHIICRIPTKFAKEENTGKTHMSNKMTPARHVHNEENYPNLRNPSQGLQHIFPADPARNTHKKAQHRCRDRTKIFPGWLELGSSFQIRWWFGVGLKFGTSRIPLLMIIMPFFRWAENRIRVHFWGGFSLGQFSLLSATFWSKNLWAKTCTLLNFGTKMCHLHCSSIFPWF